MTTWNQRQDIIERTDGWTDEWMEASVCQLQRWRDSSLHHWPSPWWCHQLKGHEAETVVNPLLPHYVQPDMGDGPVRPWVGTNLRMHCTHRRWHAIHTWTLGKNLKLRYEQIHGVGHTVLWVCMRMCACVSEYTIQRQFIQVSQLGT